MGLVHIGPLVILIAHGSKSLWVFNPHCYDCFLGISPTIVCFLLHLICKEKKYRMQTAEKENDSIPRQQKFNWLFGESICTSMIKLGEKKERENNLWGTFTESKEHESIEIKPDKWSWWATTSAPMKTSWWRRRPFQSCFYHPVRLPLSDLVMFFRRVLLKGRWMREEAIDEASYRHRVGKLVASRWEVELLPSHEQRRSREWNRWISKNSVTTGIGEF